MSLIYYFLPFSGYNLTVRDNRGLLPNFLTSYHNILNNFIWSKNKTKIFIIKSSTGGDRVKGGMFLSFQRSLAISLRRQH